MIFDAETGLPIKQECAPDILHDLQLIRREENEHPGTLQELHPRDITAAWNQLAEYRTIVTSPVSEDEARDRAIEKGMALLGALQDIYFIRVKKISVAACDVCTVGSVNPGHLTPEENQLYEALQSAMFEYLTARGFKNTPDGMELSMSKPPEVKA